MSSLNFDITYVINGGDTSAILTPSISIQKGFLLWENSVFGRINIQAFIQILYAAPLYILYQLLPLTYAHFFYWVLLFSFIPISSYILSYHLTKKMLISFFIGIFYSLNLFTAIIHHTPVYHIIYLQGVTPLLVFICLRIYEKKQIFHWKTLFFAVLFLPMLRMVNMFLVYIIFIPFLSLIIYKYYFNYNVNFKNIIKKTSVIFILILLLSTPYIITTFISQSGEITQANPNIEFSRNSVESSKVHATLINILRFTTSFGWERENFWKETSGIQSFNAAEIYHENPLFVLLTFYPIILGLFLVYLILMRGQVKKRILIFILLGISLFFLFMAKMINPPLGQINAYLYDSSSLFLIFFRSAWKYFQIPHLLLLSILVTIGIKHFFSNKLKKRRKQLIIISVLFFFQISYITPALITHSNLINEGWKVKIPQEYFEVAKFINKQDETFRILPLPLSKHVTGYTPYNWGYTGPDILYSLLEKPMIDKYNNPVLSARQLELISYIEELSHSDLNRLVNELSKLNVKYILLRTDVNTSHRFIKLWSDPVILRQSLDNAPGIIAVHEFGDLILYELENYPRLFKADFYETEQSYIRINDKTSINLQDDTVFNTVNQISFHLSFFLQDKQIENESNWKETNQQVIKTNLFQISITPEGVIHLFFYRFNNTLEGYKIQLDKKDVLEKKIDIRLLVNNQEILFIKDGFIYQFSFNGELRKEINYIQIGGKESIEKMIGNLYDISLSVNGVNLITYNDLIHLYPHLIRYEENISNEIINDPSEVKNFSLIKQLGGNNTNIVISKINNCHYRVSAQTNTSFILGFLTNFDPNWQATIYKNEKKINSVNSTPFLSFLNAFLINNSGNLTIEIKYFPQKWFEVGLFINIITIISVCGYLLLVRIKPDIFNLKQKRKH